jgi:hypothetical protein
MIVFIEGIYGGDEKADVRLFTLLVLLLAFVLAKPTTGFRK